MGSSGHPARFQVRTQAGPPAASCPQQERPRRHTGGHWGSDCKPGSLASVCAQTWPRLLGNFPQPPLSCAFPDHVPRLASSTQINGQPLNHSRGMDCSAPRKILARTIVQAVCFLKRSYGVPAPCSSTFTGSGFKFHLVRHMGFHESLTPDALSRRRS